MAVKTSLSELSAHFGAGRIDTFALYIKQGSRTHSVGPVSSLLEASSTIKVPILLILFETMAKKNHGLAHKLKKLPRHASNGSGFIGWTPEKLFSLEELIHYIIRYSDCVATNMVIDYAGGQTAVNKWFADNGYETRLNLSYLDFPGEALRPVAQTTAPELVHFFSLLMAAAEDKTLHGLIHDSLAEIVSSWSQSYLASNKLKKLKHKTGSMINCPPDGETVLNVVGSFWHQTGLVEFGLISHGYVSEALTEDAMKEVLIQRFNIELDSFIQT